MGTDAAGLPQLRADVAGEPEVRGAVAVEVADLAPFDGERELAAAARAGLDAGPRRDFARDVLARSFHATNLQVQVSFKSSGGAHDDRRGGEAQRRGGVGAALLRGARAHRLATRRSRPPPLPAPGAPPHR